MRNERKKQSRTGKGQESLNGGERLNRIIGREIAIEYKACLYFACILFFYSVYLILERRYSVSLWVIWEIVLTAYAVGYMQVYLFWNFDEAKRFGKREFFCAALCSCLYAAAAWGFGWFGRSAAATLLLAAYMMLCYLCVFFCNRWKREIDTRDLNRMLAAYKQGDGRGKVDEA